MLSIWIWNFRDIRSPWAQHPQAEATLVKVSPGGTVPTHRGGHPREVATAVGALGCHLRMGCDGGLLEGSRRLGFFLAKG
ncbi:hypothetical protein GW17_00055334 [Ensete ventricosum]|nr:hypothetical protein GW17_00055334 [Ensete ventricosum]